MDYGSTRRCMFFWCGLVFWAVALGCGSEGGSSNGVTAQIPGQAADEESSDEGKSSPRSVDTMHPVVLIETNYGTLKIKLDAANAPGTVRSFLDYASAGHYQNTTFHYVDAKMIIGGGFTPDGQEKPTTAPIRNEAHNKLKNRRGAIAMNRQAEVVDSATCQFFINVRDNPQFDYRGDAPEEYGYCVFGHVIDGMDVVDKIAATPTHDDGEFVNVPVEPVVMKWVGLARP